MEGMICGVEKLGIRQGWWRRGRGPLVLDMPLLPPGGCGPWAPDAGMSNLVFWRNSPVEFVRTVVFVRTLEELPT